MRTPFTCALLALTALTISQPAFAAPKKKSFDDEKYYSLKNEATDPDSINDPWENVNRPIFQFNLGFDKYVMKPIIYVYDVIPAPGRHRISDFLNNLREPLNAVHGVLQGDPQIFFTSTWRFILNTTFGLGGLRDFARDDANLPRYNENLGRTLGTWGVPTGPYVVLPVMGPSSVRDTGGKVGDWFLDPVQWLEDDWTSIAHATASGIDSRDRNDKIIEHLYYESLDPYVATRSAYRQNEAFKENR